MRSSRLLWRLYAQYLLITLVVLIAVSWAFARSIRDLHLEQTTRDLEVRARLLESRLAGLISPAQAEALTRLCRTLGQRTATRITVILPSGLVIAACDSLHQGQIRIDTPHLDIAYQPTEESTFWRT